MSALLVARLLAGAAVVGAVVALSFSTLADAVDTPNSENGALGFVFADFGAVGPEQPLGRAACPDGTSLGYRAIYRQSAEGQRRPDESEGDYTRRLDAGVRLASTRNGESVCMNPQLASDPHYRTMNATNVVLEGGIDLDGASGRGGGSASNVCAHDGFAGANGARGIDNQFFRVVGCRPASQSTGDTSSRNIAMYTGAWGMLVTLRGVDDIRNDDDVEIGVFANGDPIQLGVTREPLRDVTYTVHSDPRARALVHGRIRDGKLTTDRFDVVFFYDLNGMMLERPLRDARIEARLTDGEVEGYLAAYTPIEAMYDLTFGFRNGQRNGELAPLSLRTRTAAGAASAIGYTCEGGYAALQQLADGHRDPATGRCTSISTQYSFRAIPAFVVYPHDANAQGS